jgi:hypothetical protein
MAEYGCRLLSDMAGSSPPADCWMPWVTAVKRREGALERGRRYADAGYLDDRLPLPLEGRC